MGTCGRPADCGQRVSRTLLWDALYQGFLDEWMSGRPHLVIGLNAPRYREIHGDGVLLGLPEPAGLPGERGTARQLRWAYRIARELRLFRPTHF